MHLEIECCHFRSPLWFEDLGITPTLAPAIDLLHTFHLGPLHAWAMAAVWALLDAKIWAPGHMTGAEQTLVAIMAIKAALTAFYKRWDKAHPDKPGWRLKS